MDIRKCYEVLELRPGYSQDDLKQAYKDLAQVWHPDRFAHNPRLKERAEDKLKQINTAYEVLAQALVDRTRLEAARERAYGANGQSDAAKQVYQHQAAWVGSTPSRSPGQLQLLFTLWIFGVFGGLLGLIWLLAFIPWVVIILIAGLTGYLGWRWWQEQGQH
jgi:hypothetical protein